MFKRIPRTIWLLGLVSLLTDLSSEMIFPLLPLFLTTTLGASAVALGVIEGVAETTASILKVASGFLSDRMTRRKPLVVAGYGLAGLARPLIGLAGAWWFVLAMRFMDRVGKGIRTSPRDALIADAAHAGQRGAAFGIHRMMDHAGAVMGPLVAAGLLSYAGVSLRTIFLLSAIPAIAVMVVLITGVREPAKEAGRDATKAFHPRDWRKFDKNFRVLLIALLVFTLGNSTDAFILLLLAKHGVSAAWIALLWSLHHVVKMGASYLGGMASDRWGRRRMLWAGWLVYALVYFSFAYAGTQTAVIATFLVYGIYFGLTEPVEKAWVVDLTPPELRGTALGLYHGVVGLAALPASILFGVLWEVFGAEAAFLTGSALAVAAALILPFVKSGAAQGSDRQASAS